MDCTAGLFAWISGVTTVASVSLVAALTIPERWAAAQRVRGSTAIICLRAAYCCRPVLPRFARRLDDTHLDCRGGVADCRLELPVVEFAGDRVPVVHGSDSFYCRIVV